MTRPEWDKLQRSCLGGYVACSCGAHVQTLEALREHWQAGHFDVPDPDSVDYRKALEEVFALSLAWNCNDAAKHLRAIDSIVRKVLNRPAPQYTCPVRGGQEGSDVR